MHVDGVFQILIEQGELLANGIVNRSSVGWKEPQSAKLIGEKLASITWDHRTFLLDDLKGPEGHVMTAIRFDVDKNGDISLGIHTKPFNLTTGVLQIDEGLYVHNFNTTAERLTILSHLN